MLEKSFWSSWEQDWLLTNKFGRLVGPLIDKELECLAQRVCELFIVLEAVANDDVHFIFEIEQILDHALILFRVDDNGATFFLNQIRINNYQLIVFKYITDIVPLCIR